MITPTMAIYCSSCAQIVTSDKIGAFIPDDEKGVRTYCENCTLNALDDLYEMKKLEVLV